MKNRFIITLAGIFTFFISLAQTEKQHELIISLDLFSSKLQQQPKPQIIDARSAEEFALNHIEGAVNFNLQSRDYASRVQALDKSKPVFAYSINTGRSGALARDLKQQGFPEVYNLEGGIANWIGGGKPYYSASAKGLPLSEYNSIVNNNKWVLVDIGSRYCGSCKKVKPILDSLRREHGDTLKIVEVELEESPELIRDLKTVNVFPYIILYDSGEIAWKKAGINNLKKEIDVALAKNK